MGHILAPVLAALGAAASVIILASLAVAPYLHNLRIWQDTARSTPEGEAVADLFEQAVASGAVAWDREAGSVELRPLPDLDETLRLELFSIREEGHVIAQELQRAQALASYVAVRLRRPSCETPCPDADTSWQRLAGSPGQGAALRMALGASRVEGPAQVPPPLAALHFELWRGAGQGYGPWEAFGADGPFELRLDAPDVDQVDIIGRLARLPAGWRQEAAWCRDSRLRLAACVDGAAPDAVRIARIDPLAPIELSLTPRPVVPDTPFSGRHRLTERLALDCTVPQPGVGPDRAADHVHCRPIWIANPMTRRFSHSALPGDAQTNGAGGVRLPIPALEGWMATLTDAEGERVGLVPTSMANETGAMAVLGGIGLLPGGLADAMASLGRDAGVSVTLGPDFQRIAHERMRDLLDRPAGGAFNDLTYRFPSGGPEMSLVVLDLRAEPGPGAIRAVVGSPAPPAGLSRWDLLAATRDPATNLPPGPAAWTGRGRQHVPGSAWKMVTALALVDMATDPRLPLAARRDLRRLIDGVSGSEADAILGAGVMTSPWGLCVPNRRGLPMTGATRDGCGQGYAPPIRDSGRGAPLAYASEASMGLREAIALSSNIWFASLLLWAEAAYAQAGGLPPANAEAAYLEGSTVQLGVGLAGTLSRLGLDRPQELDAGRGLSLLPRDGAMVEALSGGQQDLRALAAAAFGQQVQAGPLILSQIAGSIRTGQDIRPSLLAPMPRPGLLSPTDGLATALMQDLRAGMLGVVSGQEIMPGGRVGTAVDPFRMRAGALRQRRIGGKTGTAQQSDDSAIRISTFAGWLDTPEGAPGLAIGCSASVIGERRGAGQGLRVPPVCAHLVAQVMADIDAAGLLDR